MLSSTVNFDFGYKDSNYIHESKQLRHVLSGWGAIALYPEYVCVYG